MAIINDAPKHVGPFETEDEAKREAFNLNENRGGPGFHVRLFDRDLGEKYVDGPYAYMASETEPGRWYAELTLRRDL